MARQSWGTILCIDVPRGTSMCLDTHAFTTGERFLGVGGVPVGPHVLTFASREGAPRSSTAFTIAAGDVVIYAWSTATELLERVCEDVCASAATDVCEEIRTAGAGMDISALARAARADALVDRLMPYHMPTHPRWQRLSSSMSRAVLDRIMPVGGVLNPTHTRADAAVYERHPLELPPTASLASASSAAAADVHNPGAVVSPREPAGRVHFTRIVGTDRDTAAHVRTAYAHDTSTALFDVLSRLRRLEARDASVAEVTDDAVIQQYTGEMQLSFVLFLIGENLHALQQWKLMANSILCAEDAFIEAAGRNPPVPAAFFVAAIRCFQAQVDELPKDFFMDPLSGQSFVSDILRKFGRILHNSRETASRSAHWHAGVQLLTAVRERFGYEPYALSLLADTTAPSPASRAAAAQDGGYRTQDELLAALEDDAEGDDLPVIVVEGSDTFVV